MKEITIVIPSLNPGKELLEVIQGLRNEKFENIIVLDDGSDEKYKSYFKTAEADYGCIVLEHGVNRGKGAAIKTAINYILKSDDLRIETEKGGIITVDGDNQHKATDVKRCAEKMLEKKEYIILGARTFEDKSIPFRSRFGNKLTCGIFNFLCGMKLSDTQTGLRAIPFQYLELMLGVVGDRYEYETNMLLEIKKEKIPYTEIKIETVYINENQTSHFNPLLDSVKIYKYILKFCLSSFSASLIDIGIFSLLIFLLSFMNLNNSKVILLATVGARIVSSFFNYIVNRNVVFHAKNSKNTLAKYYSLCVIQMLASYGLVMITTCAFSSVIGGSTVFIKIVVDSILFLLSYQVQQRWIFS